MDTLKHPDIHWELIPEHAHVMRWQEFAESARIGDLTPDDGSGFWATNEVETNLSVWEHERPTSCRFVTWYNR